jgi:flavin-dependent dehydrogenase
VRPGGGRGWRIRKSAFDAWLGKQREPAEGVDIDTEARQIADLQHADSKVLESVAEKADEQARQLASIDKTVTLIDRDSFRREPTR